MKSFDYLNVKAQSADVTGKTKGPISHTYAKPEVEPEQSRPDVNIVVQPVKTDEQLAQDRLNAEKKEAQNTVDSVLYQDVRSEKKVVPVSNQNKSVESNDIATVNPSVPVNNTVHSQSQQDSVNASTRYEDTVVKDFEQNFDNVDDSDAVNVTPDDLKNKQIVEPVVNQSVQQDTSSSNNTQISNTQVSVEPVAAKMPVVQKVNTSSSNNQKVLIKSEQKVDDKGDWRTKCATLRDVPSYLVDLCRVNYFSEYGKSINQSEIVNACLYQFLGRPRPTDVDLNLIQVKGFDLQKINEMLANYEGTDMNDPGALASLRDELADAALFYKSALKEIQYKLACIEQGVVYSNYDRLGFSTNVINEPRDVKFCEEGANVLRNNLETQTLNMINKEKRKNGVPYK